MKNEEAEKTRIFVKNEIKNIENKICLLYSIFYKTYGFFRFIGVIYVFRIIGNFAEKYDNQMNNYKETMTYF